MNENDSKHSQSKIKRLKQRLKVATTNEVLETIGLVNS